MRILLTTPTYPPFNSGLGNAVAQQADCLSKAGHKVVVATGGATRSSREQAGIQVETFAVQGADSWLQPIRGEVEGYLDFLRNHDGDVVLLNAWQNWATDLALNHLEEISGKHVLYSHCISTNVFFATQPIRSAFRYLGWRPYWWRLSQRMKRLDGVLFLAKGGGDSRFDDMILARRHGVAFRIVPNSLSSAATALLEKPAMQISVRDRLMAVGSYQWQKGFDFILRAYAASKARNRFPLHLYGQKFSAYNVILQDLVCQLGLQKGQVVFHEGVYGEPLLEAYSCSRLLLSGSHTECQPLALIDANATGTPFVARSTGCITKMPGGLAVHSVQDMTGQIDVLVKEDSIWQALADAGREAALNTYHPARTTQMLLTALSEFGCITDH